MDLWLAIVLIVAFCVIGFVLGMTYRKKVAEREISSAEDEAKRIINDAIKSAESKKREALVEAKEEIHKSRSEFEREEKARRADLQKQERRLQQKEENLDRKTDSLERKNETLALKIADVEAQQQEIALIKKSQLETLEKLSGLNADAGTTILMVTHDCNAASYCKRILFIQDGVLFHELRRDVPDETQQAFYGRILAVMAQLGGGSANVL